MLYIKKRKTSEEIKEAVQKIIDEPLNGYREITIPGDAGKLRSIFDSPQMPKEKIRAELCKEQHGLCAYCMRRIYPCRPHEKDGDYTRIEHYVPLSKNKEKALDYQNFLGVCFGGEHDKKDNENDCEKETYCCDKTRENDILTIDPHNQRQMEAIAYERNGRIKVRDNIGLDPDLVINMQDDIDFKLCLNGEVNKDTKALGYDTKSHLRGSRQAVYDSVASQFARWDRQHKLTSDFLAEKIKYLNSQLQGDENAEPYIGVRLYWYENKRKRLAKMGC